MDAWEALKQKDYIPYGGDLVNDNCCFAHWTDCLCYTQLCYEKIDQIDDDKNWIWTAQELCRHSQLGEFPFWDEWIVLGHLFREQGPYLPVGYEGYVDYRQLFRQGKVAMYMEGNWALADYKSDPPPFEFGWLEYPVLTKDIWPAVPETVCRIEGAWGGMQYHMPGYLTETDPDKIGVLMDFLMFVSKPENVSKNLQENSTLPLIYGAEGQEGLEPFFEPYDFDIIWAAWNNLSGSAREVEHQLWQSYVPTDMSDDEFLEKSQEAWETELQKVLETNPEWKI
jgi:ABC-type glycerol-3-phosphate transport system substrate-binding protein